MNCHETIIPSALETPMIEFETEAIPAAVTFCAFLLDCVLDVCGLVTTPSLRLVDVGWDW